MSIQFYIPYPKTKAQRSAWSRRYSLNAYYAGKNFRERQEDAEFWHGMAAAYMRLQGIRREILTKPCIISISFDDGLDIDNHGAITKMIIDAMKGYILKDDSRHYVIGVYQGFHTLEDPLERRIIVRVETVDGEGAV